PVRLRLLVWTQHSLSRSCPAKHRNLASVLTQPVREQHLLAHPPQELPAVRTPQERPVVRPPHAISPAPDPIQPRAPGPPRFCPHRPRWLLRPHPRHPFRGAYRSPRPQRARLGSLSSFMDAPPQPPKSAKQYSSRNFLPLVCSIHLNRSSLWALSKPV